MDKLKRFIILVLSVAMFGWPAATFAQTTPRQEIILSGPAGIVLPDQTFSVDVQLQTNGVQVNAAEIHLAYDRTALDVISISRAQSIFTLWPEEPAVNRQSGEITLTGGRPNGIIAINGLVATITFVAHQTGTANITVNTAASAVYLNNGQGTKRELVSTPLALEVIDDLGQGIRLSSTTHPTQQTWSRGGTISVQWDTRPGSAYSYLLSTSRQDVPDETPEDTNGSVTYSDQADGVYYFTIKERADNGTWSAIYQRVFLLDQTPPQPFHIDRIPATFGHNRASLSWVAMDETSGIVASELAINGRSAGTVTNPLAIQAGWTGKIISITARDAAGNARTEKILISQSQSPWLAWILLAVAALVAAGIAVSRSHLKVGRA